MVELTNLTATEEYQVTVSSDSANVGIGGCGTTSQQATVTGVAERDLVFVVYACTVGEATVTAEVRRTGAASAEATVSQRLTGGGDPRECDWGAGGAGAAGGGRGGAEGRHARERAEHLLRPKVLDVGAREVGHAE